MLLKVQKLHEDAVIPQYAHANDSGMDLCAIEEMIIPAGGRKLVKTGISIELMPDTEAQIRPKSGLALKHGISVSNSPGTVDEGYRGDIGVILEYNPVPFTLFDWLKIRFWQIFLGEPYLDTRTFVVKKGMKIAQMVITPVLRPEIEVVDALTDTTRGAGGFGSTGM